MNSQVKTIIILCLFIVLTMCPLLVLIAIRGEKRIIKDKFIKGFLGWPDVYGEKVPIVARRYKIITITFSSVILIFTVCGSIYLLTKK